MSTNNKPTLLTIHNDSGDHTHVVLFPIERDGGVLGFDFAMGEYNIYTQKDVEEKDIPADVLERLKKRIEKDKQKDNT